MHTEYKRLHYICLRLFVHRAGPNNEFCQRFPAHRRIFPSLGSSDRHLYCECQTRGEGSIDVSASAREEASAGATDDEYVARGPSHLSGVRERGSHVLVVVTDQGIPPGGQAHERPGILRHVVSTGQRHVIEFCGATSVDKGSHHSARCGSGGPSMNARRHKCHHSCIPDSCALVIRSMSSRGLAGQDGRNCRISLWNEQESAAMTDCVRTCRRDSHALKRRTRKTNQDSLC